jgi:hypothetical protein
MSQAGERYIGGFVATVPEGYVVTIQHGVDFSVDHLLKITEFGDPACSLSIYTGNYPQPLSSGPQVATSKAELLGVPTQWRETVRTENAETVIFSEAMLPLQGSPSARFAHIFLRSGTSTQMGELKHIAASLRLAPPNSDKSFSIPKAIIIPKATIKDRWM